jgi:hypothetical protein
MLIDPFINIVSETTGLMCPPETPPIIVIAARNAATM